MPGKVIRLIDYDRKSRDADAEHPRDPAEPCVIVILPVVKIETHPDKPRHARRRGWA